MKVDVVYSSLLWCFLGSNFSLITQLALSTLKPTFAHIPNTLSGDGWCSPEYNIPECSYDGGDCDILRELGDCDVPYPSLLVSILAT